MSTGPARLRSLLRRDVPIVAPLALDPLAALTAEAVGFESLYIGGGALGYTKTFTEANLALSELIDVGNDVRAVSDLPLMLDGTCGWGDPMHIRHTIAVAEAAGMAAIELEDQLFPKRAHHHIDIEHLIPLELMVAKIEAAVSARRDQDFTIIARTNACRTDDLGEARRRAEAYQNAGADLLLVMPRTPEQAEGIATTIDAPLVYMTLGGVPSMGMSLEEAGSLGYRIVIDAMTPLLAKQKALRLCYDAIARGDADPTFGSNYGDEVDKIHHLIGLESMLAIERRTVETHSYIPAKQ
ncbi:isocitrate lyase/PEP mutase family protein [Rhodococcus opacus]|uniref:isocitrate lyase/PEP mutase family protein n=1 Tax=Rhodococcus opacus TaxID=37919 RepID=UPI001C484D0B|nr:isocitrate lyase/PEP mutase family protein [Rhodococcus opacus]MBV6756668.1 isocitrate lyase/PEP mutase family protein [Rhodococcus opacus]